MAWETHFFVFWLPLGVPWEAVFDQQVYFFRGPFLGSLFGDEGGVFWEGSAAGAEPV